MTEPNCGECPLKGSPQVCGEGIWIEETTSEQRDSANPELLLKLVHQVKEQRDSYRIVMAGMAPANDEVAQGRVLVGISGKILKSLLVKLGYREVYLCNCLLCQIPDSLSDRDRALAVKCCSSRFVDEIKSKKPELIVAMGAMPMEQLIGNYSIIRTAGRVFPTDFTVHKIAPAVSTIHPAFVWRNTEVFYDFVEQLQSGLRWLEGSYQSAVAPKWIVATSENIDEILDTIEKGTVGAIDLETTTNGFYPYGHDPDKIRCIVVSLDTKTSYIIPGFHCAKDNPYWNQWTGDEIEYENLLFHPRLKPVLENFPYWRTHNGQFDCGFLLQIGISIKIAFDSMLASYTTDEREFAHSLKKISHKFLGAPDWEDDIRLYTTKKKDSYDKIPNSKLFEYAAHDGVYTNQISERLEGEVVTNWCFNNILMPSANMFNDLRHRGLRINPRLLMSLDSKLEDELSKGLDELNDLVGEPVSPTSPKEVSELLYDKLGFPINRKYGRSSGKKAISAFLPNPIVEKILECRSLSKMKNTYVESLAKFIDLDIRIHPFTKLFSSVTGRISTEDPSVMNVVKKGGIMNLYLPDKGHLLAALDQGQMEMRCGALVTEDEVMRQILLDPTRDPHRECATFAFGADRAAEKRGSIKTVVFGTFYGRSVDSIQYALKLTRQEALDLVELVNSFFPGLHIYQTRIKKELREKGYLVSYFGRYRRFGLITRENVREYERQGFNFPVQSMASDINLLCMIKLYNMRYETGAMPLWPIHDSIIFDIQDTSVIPDLKKIMEKYSEELVDHRMKFIVEAKVGENWGDAMVWKEEGDGLEGRR